MMPVPACSACSWSSQANVRSNYSAIFRILPSHLRIINQKQANASSLHGTKCL